MNQVDKTRSKTKPDDALESLCSWSKVSQFDPYHHLFRKDPNLEDVLPPIALFRWSPRYTILVFSLLAVAIESVF